MKKMTSLFLVLIFSTSLGCASLSGGVADAGDSVGNTVANVANDSAAVLDRAVALNFPGLVLALGDAAANLLRGIASLAAVPLTTLENMGGETMDMVNGDSDEGATGGGDSL